MDVRKGLGVNMKKSLKRSSKNKPTMKKNSSLVIKGIVDYLKSDSYFYSPIVSPLPSHVCSTPDAEYISSLRGSKVNEPLMRQDGKLKEKMLQYLKSDSYLYVPLEDAQSLHHVVERIMSAANGLGVPPNRVANMLPLNKKASQTQRVQDGPLGKKQKDEKKRDESYRGVPHDDANVIIPATPALREVRTEVVRRSYRLSAVHPSQTVT